MKRNLLNILALMSTCLQTRWNFSLRTKRCLNTVAVMHKFPLFWIFRFMAQEGGGAQVGGRIGRRKWYYWLICSGKFWSLCGKYGGRDAEVSSFWGRFSRCRTFFSTFIVHTDLNICLNIRLNLDQSGTNASNTIASICKFPILGAFSLLSNPSPLISVNLL